jgi:hypothetical protein
MSNIAEVIRQKERELHDIHSMRCSQLEEMVTEREQLLIESSK